MGAVGELGSRLAGLRTQNTGTALRALAESRIWPLRTVPQVSGQDQGGNCLLPRWELLGTTTEQTKYYPDLHRLRCKILPDQRLPGLT